MRARERTDQLSSGFNFALETFAMARPFTGPSLYFHYRAVESIRISESITKALSEQVNLEYLYAMLTAWGMHRLGSKGSELVSFNEFGESLRRIAPALDEMKEASIADEDVKVDSEGLAGYLWNLIREARVSDTSSQLVAGSKTLHHLLPELVPPIDRRYTGSFFFGSGGRMWSMGEERAFMEMYPLLVELADRNKSSIARALESPDGDMLSYMSTSTTKVLDNAIIGFVRLNDL